MRWLGMLVGLLVAQSAIAAPIQVKVSFIEALAPRDTTSSERFQKEFEKAIQVGKEELKPRLKSCWYELETSTDFYDASDPLQAKERGEKAAKEGVWLIFGPRRSNHYLLLAQGAPNTPTLSPMASASEVAGLGTLHLSLSPLNSEMAARAAHEAAKRTRTQGNQRTYVSIVSQDCLTCVDFAEHFVATAKRLGLREAERISISGDLPAIEPLREKILNVRPAFILLPNFSKVSSHVMAGVQDAAPKAFFVGGDGWGDSQFGFVHNGKNLDALTGVTVRGFPPIQEGLRAFPLGRRVLAEPKDQAAASSGPGLAILKAMESTVNLLCRDKPKSPTEFRWLFEKRAKKEFAAPWGVSVYDLRRGQIVYRSKGEGVR